MIRLLLALGLLLPVLAVVVGRVLRRRRQAHEHWAHEEAEWQRVQQVIGAHESRRRRRVGGGGDDAA